MLITLAVSTLVIADTIAIFIHESRTILILNIIPGTQLLSELLHLLTYFLSLLFSQLVHPTLAKGLLNCCRLGWTAMIVSSGYNTDGRNHQRHDQYSSNHFCFPLIVTPPIF
jgi:hypothetical protein